jgi:hypothetical protein
MRLATCIAAEIAVGVCLFIAVTGGAVWAIGLGRGEDPGAGAELRPGAGAPVRDAGRDGMERTALVEARRAEAVARPAAPPDAEPAGARFAGKPDAELLAPLRDAAIAKVKIGTCCTSLNMRIDFDSGARAAFKPEQRNLGSMPRKEIAAYRVDRLLRIGAVAPAIGRRLLVADITAHIAGGSAEDRARFESEMVTHDGAIDGELTWWIPELSKPMIDGVLIDAAEGVAAWQGYLALGRAVPAKHRALLAQISNVVLFDFIINNIDRWSGGNVLASKGGAVLYFMDNTMAFRPQPRGHAKVSAYLRRCQKFSRSLVEALRRLRLEDVRDALDDDLGPFSYLLTETEMGALMARRDAAIRYIDGLIARGGEDAVLAFP